MHRKLTLLLVLVAACSSDPGEDGPAGPVGNAISGALQRAWIAAVSPQQVTLEHDLFQLPSAELNGDVGSQTCTAVNNALFEACEEITANPTSGYVYCWPQATFRWANDIPRCNVRMTLMTGDEDLIPATWVMDFTGEPYDGPAPHCGNGELEPGEDCDDGNNENWDGCDQNCRTEEFTGCEAVIEYHYKLQELAVVDKNLWDGPSSHMMVNTTAVPIRPVGQQTCNAALATGYDVCNELSATMPFVSWCSPSTEYFEDEVGPACAVQFQVGFLSTDPASGVFTTALNGILAFTIR